MVEVKVPASGRDKKIGWILLAIGILWILAIILIEYGNYKSPLNNRTLGQLMIGIGLNSLFPLLFVTSGQYYLSGGNAKRIEKKAKPNQGAPLQGIISASPTVTLAPPIAGSAEQGATATAAPVNPRQQSENFPNENQSQ